jgi:antitoxin ParD1/3/4
LAYFDKKCHSDRLGVEAQEYIMATLNISLPEQLREYVDAKVAAGGYGTASEYVRELIRADQKRAAEERLEALLLEGLDSGEPITIFDAWWERKKAVLTEQLKKDKDA